MAPRMALTLGDVAGIGPEVVVRALSAGPGSLIVVGHPAVLRRAIKLVGADIEVREVDDSRFRVADAGSIPCWNPAGDDAAEVPPGQNDPRAGRAAYDYLSAATRAALVGAVDAIVTAPL